MHVIIDSYGPWIQYTWLLLGEISTFDERDDKWNIACHINKQRISQPSSVATLQRKPVSPEETQEGKKDCHLAAIRL